jgi:DNA-binding transcriptional MerR regulator
MDKPDLRVGELARRTGLTVRTLHHWDQVGLLTPTRRTPAQLDLLQDLAGRLDRVLGLLAEDKIVTEEELIKTMEMMTMIEKHFSPEQLEALKKREAALGPEAIREAQEEWPRLIASVREAMEKGTDPASDQVQALAKRWKGLIQAFSGGDSKIETSLSGMYKAEPDMAAQQGLDPELFSYIGAAMKADAGRK